MPGFDPINNWIWRPTTNRKKADDKYFRAKGIKGAIQRTPEKGKPSGREKGAAL